MFVIVFEKFRAGETPFRVVGPFDTVGMAVGYLKKRGYKASESPRLWSKYLRHKDKRGKTIAAEIHRLSKP